MGYASAMAVLLLAVAFALTLVIIRGSSRFVHYQGAAR
jgi:ABC-type sugar transport system permease subunit